jgi:hypothetical protein
MNGKANSNYVDYHPVRNQQASSGVRTLQRTGVSICGASQRTGPVRGSAIAPDASFSGKTQGNGCLPSETVGQSNLRCRRSSRSLISRSCSPCERPLGRRRSCPSVRIGPAESLGGGPVQAIVSMSNRH